MTFGPVSTQVIRVIKQGCEEAFEQSLRDFFLDAKPIPGQLSVNVVRPIVGSGSREWGILRTFESDAHRDQFFASEQFKAYAAHVAQFTEGPPKLEHVCGLETWFALPGSRSIIPPPRWKMAVVTFVGVYFTVNMVGVAIGTRLQGLHPLLISAVSVAVTVACLTWLVMPALARVFRPWLSR